MCLCSNSSCACMHARIPGSRWVLGTLALPPFPPPPAVQQHPEPASPPMPAASGQADSDIEDAYSQPDAPGKIVQITVGGCSTWVLNRGCWAAWV